MALVLGSAYGGALIGSGPYGGPLVERPEMSGAALAGGGSADGLVSRSHGSISAGLGFDVARSCLPSPNALAGSHPLWLSWHGLRFGR